ncbi:MAG: flavin reductase family protein [Thermoplasmatota archaeon]
MDLTPGDYLKATGPLPLVLVSTLYKETKNVAPYAWMMPISIDPPILGVAIRKIRDTFKNIMETGEFVVSVPGPELKEKIIKTAASLPRDKSEFDHAGLTPKKSKVVAPPGVAECLTQIECRLEWAKEAGDHHVVVGRVVNVSINKELEEKGIDANFPDAIMHIGGGRNLYGRVNELVQ